ncbi:MAG: hypothetical protein FWC38_08040 [Proteobacteria bacterium]|nr:hypothetical protein [Pseudomonadota bacterium]MCL2308150.1 hypothetical protein [Pseudomonadota bacterium]
MSETRLPIRVACSGLGERDVFIVRSLLRILDARRGRQPWVFEEDGQADVIITPSVHNESDQMRLAVRRTPSSRFVLTVPNGVAVNLPPGIRVVHYPLRASELLECFDRLEGEWPFNTATGMPGVVAPRQTVTLAPEIRTTTLPTTQPSVWTDPRLSQVPTDMRVSHVPTDFRTTQIPSTGLHPSQIPTDLRLSQLPEGRVLTVGVAQATGMGALSRPATVGSLMQAMRSLRSSLEGERPQGRSIDVFDQLGWIGRLYNGRRKIYASRRFMLDRSAEPAGGRSFQWKFTLSGLPPLTKSDALIEIDLDLFAWPFSTRFCYDFASLDLPINALLHLRRWPDFGVQPEFSSRSGVMLATALLTRQTLSLAALRRESETSEADLARLLSVCWLSGWLRCERQMPKASQKAPAEKTAFSGIVRSLRRVLGLSRR